MDNELNRYILQIFLSALASKWKALQSKHMIKTHSGWTHLYSSQRWQHPRSQAEEFWRAAVWLLTELVFWILLPSVADYLRAWWNKKEYFLNLWMSSILIILVWYIQWIHTEYIASNFWCYSSNMRKHNCLPDISI